MIQLDTPGGLDSSMRQIVQAISNARVPVIVYVAPSGARAASAGVFITMTAQVAAMAPGTNIGAAHPVSIGMGGKIDPTMEKKVLNDFVAYGRALAEETGPERRLDGKGHPAERLHFGHRSPETQGRRSDGRQPERLAGQDQRPAGAGAGQTTGAQNHRGAGQRNPRGPAPSAS